MTQILVFIKDSKTKSFCYLLNALPLFVIYILFLLITNRYVLSLVITFIFSTTFFALNKIKMTFWAFPITLHDIFVFKDFYTLKETLYN